MAISNNGPPQCYVFWNLHRGLEEANTAGRSLFEAARRALEHFQQGYGPKPSAETILRVEVHTPGQPKRTFHVRAGRGVEFYGLDPKEWLA